MQSLFDRLSTLWSGLPWYVQLFAFGSCIVLFRPRTPEAYEALASRSPKWLFPRLVGLMQFGAGFFSDYLKMKEAGKKIVLGTYLTASEERASKSIPPNGGAQ